MGLSTLNSASAESTESRELLKAANPNLCRVNAFRITGLNVDARPRDIARHFQKLEMLERLGSSNGAPGPFPLDPPPDGDAFREAKQRLNDPQRRLIDEFFWFWPDELGQGRVDEALTALAQGDIRAAVQTWMQRENSQSESNVSMHNLAVLSLTWALDLEQAASRRALSEEEKKLRDNHWRLSYKRWRVLLDHSGFWNRLSGRIREMDDPRLTPGGAQELRRSLPLALLSINAELAVQAAERGNTDEAKRHVAILAASEFEQGVVNEALRQATQPVRDRLKALCRAAEPEADRDVVHSDQVVLRLVHEAQPLLASLDCILSPGHATREGAHDEVALTGLRCQIAFGNKTENWKVSSQLLGMLLPIAASQSARARVEENLKIVKGNLQYQEEYGTCWFCKRNPPVPTVAAELVMHGNVKRQYGRVQWQTLTLKIPRCPACNSAHSRGKGFATLGALLGIVIDVVLWVSFPDAGALWFVGLFGFGYGGAAVGRLLAKTAGIQPETYAKSYPRILREQKQGWGLGAKPPGVK